MKKYDDAVAEAKSVMARDDEKIAPFAKTLLIEHGSKRPWSVVLFHGLTNNPGQFAKLAPMIAELGHNVFAPRMPYHGYADRITNDLSKLTSGDLRRAADEAVDIALGLGDRVAVMGISLGATQCAYLAQNRSDVSASIPIAPDFGVLNFSHDLVVMLAAGLALLPNFYMWWDPRVREAQLPLTAYPRFATKALLASLQIADDVYAASKKEAPKAKKLVTVVNRADPAVSNEVTKQVVDAWKSRRASGIEYDVLTGLPENHDIIDPNNPLQRIDIVYPKLLAILRQAQDDCAPQDDG